MWFDAHAALRGETGTPATTATTATTATNGPIVAEVAVVAAAHTSLIDARELFEERAAIRQFEGGQPRSEAEAAALGEAARTCGVSVTDLRTHLGRADREANAGPSEPGSDAR